MQLTAGANTVLPASTIQLSIQHQSNTPIEVDVTAYVLNANGKVRGDADMIFYGQTQTANSSIVLQIQNQNHQFQLNTDKIDADVQKIAICVTLNAPNNIGHLQQLHLKVSDHNNTIATAAVTCTQRQEAALILAEVYRHKEQWKIRYVEQGFNGGLQPLAEHFGVDIASPATTTPPTAPATATPSIPSSAPKVSLSKITLNKSNSRISLSKKSNGFGRISVNLNWNQNPNTQTPAANSGFLKKLLNSGRNNGIDLDLGAMLQYQDGNIDLVQALGNRFGNLDQAPYIQLQGDDRTGQNQDGEWLHINGQHWSKLKKVVIYAFIYEGVPNWAQTDGVITINVPEQAPIEIALTDGRQLPLCGIVELVNDNGSIQVNRIVEYFKSQLELDQRFGFGFQWKAGKK